MKKMLLSSLFAAMLVSGCGNQSTSENNEAAAPPPTIDVSTPDRAVKSLWAAIDWHRAVEAADAKRLAKSGPELSWQKLYAQLNGKEIVAQSTKTFEFEKYSREILQANVETESRAVVLAVIKNITPLPTGAALKNYEKKLRDEGSRIKYVLEKSGANWQISEAWEWEDYENSFKKSRPHSWTFYPVHTTYAW